MKYSFLFGAILLLTGCSSISIPAEETNTAYFKDILEGNKGKLILTDGTELMVNRAVVKGDSVQWITTTDQEGGATLNEVASFTQINRTHGVVVGILAGAGAATLISLPIANDAGIGGEYIVFAGAGVGALIGAIVGSKTGLRRAYHFPANQAQH